MIDSMIDATPRLALRQTGLSGTLRAQLSHGCKANYANLLGYSRPQSSARRLRPCKSRLKTCRKPSTKSRGRLVAQAHDRPTSQPRANEQQTTGVTGVLKSPIRLQASATISCEYTLRQREFESNRTLYEGLAPAHPHRQPCRPAWSRRKSTSSTPPWRRSYPSLSSPVLRMLILYSAIGLVIGVILAFLLESLDTGLRNVAEIEAVTGLASLALIPRARRSSCRPSHCSTPLAQRNLAMVLGNPKSQFAESFRAMRTSLLLSTAGHPPRDRSAHQRYAVRRQDHHLHQPGLRPCSARCPRPAGGRRPPASHRASSFRLSTDASVSPLCSPAKLHHRGSCADACPNSPISISSPAARSPRSPPRCSAPRR